MVAEVIINSTVKNLNRIFDYKIPEELEEKVSIGSRVLLPFGNKKELEEGFVVNLKETSEYINKLKEIAKRSLDRELNRNNIEIKKLENSIARLKPSNININYRIPERIKRIEELKLYNEEILKDKNSL